MNKISLKQKNKQTKKKKKNQKKKPPKQNKANMGESGLRGDLMIFLFVFLLLSALHVSTHVVLSVGDVIWCRFEFHMEEINPYTQSTVAFASFREESPMSIPVTQT